MAKPTWIFTNLCLRQNPKSFIGSNHFRIRNQSLSIDQISGNAEESTRNPETPDEICGQNQVFEVGEVSGTVEEFVLKPLNLDESIHQNQFLYASEIAKEVSVFIRAQPRWEQTLTIVFPTVNFVDPNIYNEVLKQQNNVFLSIRFYHWLKSLNGFSLDPILCKEIFRRLVEANAAKAAESFLKETKFEPEPEHLELYIGCLSENGLVELAFDVFERLKMIGHCAPLQTWNSALSCALRTKRLDIFWALYGDMMQHNVVPDIDTTGYLTRAFCIDNNATKGYNLLRRVLEDGHVPSKIVFNKLVAAFCKSGDYGKMSSVLHMMIAKNCSPDIYTYQEIINGLNKRKMRYEGFRVFSDLKCRGYFPDRVMYTTMIHGLCNNKWLGDARKVWFEMTQNGIVPNEYTYNAFINGLWRIGSIDEAEKLYKEMISKGYAVMLILSFANTGGFYLEGLSLETVQFGRSGKTDTTVKLFADRFLNVQTVYINKISNSGATKLGKRRCAVGSSTSTTRLAVDLLKMLEAVQPEKLSLIWCSYVTDLGLRSFAEKCRTLKSLDLQGGYIGDEGLAAVGACCSRLNDLICGFVKL